MVRRVIEVSNTIDLEVLLLLELEKVSTELCVVTNDLLNSMIVGWVQAIMATGCNKYRMGVDQRQPMVFQP